MKYTLIVLAALTALTSAVHSQPQPPDTLWTRSFGGNDNDYAYSVEQTNDGGYIIAGRTRSFGAGGYDIFLIRTDVAGDTLWIRTYGGPGSYDECRSVQQTPDSGFILVGTTNSYGAGFEDIFILKTNINGDSIWMRTFGGGSVDHGREVQQTNNGGYIVAGLTQSYGAGRGDVYLIQTDAEGNTIWTRTFGGSGNDSGRSIQKTSDGGFIITGETSAGIGGYNVYLIKTDSSGNSQWLRSYGGSSNDNGYCVHQTSDGGYIITGKTSSFGFGRDDVYLIKTDADGDTLWTRTFGGSEMDIGYAVLQTSDGGYIVAGENSSIGAGLSDAYLIKTDANGNTLWTQTYGDSLFEFFGDIQPTFDAGYILCGSKSSSGPSDPNVWLVKLEGEMTLTLTPTVPIINIPSLGGSFFFTSSICNNVADTMIFDAWTLVTLPNGRSLEPVLLRNGLNMAPAATITREINQYVPGNAPPGNYMYIGNIGFYPDSVMDSDEFGFVKLP